MNSTYQTYHLLILSQHSEIYKLLIEQKHLPGLSITAFDGPNQAIISGVEYDMVFGEPSLISQVLNRIKNVKWVQSSWAGVEPLLQLNMRRDYLLTNIRNVYGPMMSEFVFAYLLMIERRILPRWQSQLRGDWDDQSCGSLKGKIFGLMGVGTIGSHLAATARHFGMRVYGYTRQSEACPEVDKYFHAGNQAEFAAELDYLICCLPGTNETKKIVDAQLLASLPRRAWLLNVGRGSTVDEKALVRALNNGSLAGAVLDVFSEEPLPRGHPLWSAQNTFITAHTAATNNPPDIVNVFIDNYFRFIHNESLNYQVSFELAY